jgi:hypothetical protein
MNFLSVTVETNVNAFYDILFLATKRANWSKELILSLNSPNSVRNMVYPLCSDFIVFFRIQHSPVSQKAKAYQFVKATSLGVKEPGNPLFNRIESGRGHLFLHFLTSIPLNSKVAQQGR